MKNKETQFAEWLAENHYRLRDISGKEYYWTDEVEIRTTDQLYKRFLKEQ